MKIIVIGAGHAGVEAAYTLNKLGDDVSLVTFHEDDIASLPCNVSIGGSAKGILVNDLDALGGLMSLAADETQLQTKILNQSKGPAVRALRAQIDKIDYPKYIKEVILNSKIKVIVDEASSLIIEDSIVKGINLKAKGPLYADAVIIATGTFLRAKTMKGEIITEEGPDGKKTSKGISEQLLDYDVELIRLKTGTPPRIKTSSIDFSVMKKEPGSSLPIWFTINRKVNKKFENIPAYLVYTNKNTHQIIKDNIKHSYLYSEEIEGAGPRYCPSIEDKVKRFADKDRHQIFLEIESKHLDTTYLSGLSSSMPDWVQEQFVRTIPGLEKCIFEKYAYSIEYDSLNPLQLKQTLELKQLQNLYFAGQVNGTSGYEEAAVQGLWAAVNAHNKFYKKDPFILDRNESYIGVMIDDITTKGILDPYRVLSSRAEYRLLLRTDNAIKRLNEKAFSNNLISIKEYQTNKIHLQKMEEVKANLWKARLKKSDPRFVKLLEQKNVSINVASIPALTIVKRPEFNLEEFREILQEQIPVIKEISKNDLITLGIEVKFEGYLAKQEREVKKYLKYQKLQLPENLDYNNIPNLALEAREKLNKFKPMSIHQATNITGINPSDIMVLVHFLNKKKIL